MARQRIKSALSLPNTSEAEAEAEATRAAETLKVAKLTGALPANTHTQSV